MPLTDSLELREALLDGHFGKAFEEQDMRSYLTDEGAVISYHMGLCVTAAHAEPVRQYSSYISG